MFNKWKSTSHQVSPDSLVRRIGTRSHSEHTKQQLVDGYWRGAFAGSRATGMGVIGIPVAFLIWMLGVAVYAAGSVAREEYKKVFGRRKANKKKSKKRQRIRTVYRNF